MKATLLIKPDGTIYLIHNDVLVQALIDTEGRVSIKRASHVEPLPVPVDGKTWVADLHPVGGPVLGPFKGRDEALAAEVKWLGENMAKAVSTLFGGS